MSELVGAGAILALIVIATLAGLLVKCFGSRVRKIDNAEAIDPSDFGPAELGSHGTVVQFSTEYCSRCPSVKRTLHDIIGSQSGVNFIHVDVTHTPEIAKKYNLLQTPTVLIVGADGTPLTRLSGSLSRDTLVDAVGALADGSSESAGREDLYSLR